MKKPGAEPYRDIDFSRAKRGAVIKAEPGKTKASIRLTTASGRRGKRPPGGGRFWNASN